MRKTDEMTKPLKAMTPGEFATLGMRDIVYILPATMDGKSVFAIQTAAGQTAAVADSLEAAEAAITERHMTAVRVH